MGDLFTIKIQVGDKSSELIGRLLSAEYQMKIIYPMLGKFSSVYSLWIWLKDDKCNNKIRVMSTEEIRDYVYHNKPIKRRYINNFKCIIGHATWLKFKNNEQAKIDVRVIHDTDNIVLDIKDFTPGWMEDISKIIFQAIKNKKEPDFTSLASHPNSVRKYFIEDFLNSVYPGIF